MSPFIVCFEVVVVMGRGGNVDQGRYCLGDVILCRDVCRTTVVYLVIVSSRV